MFVCHPDETVEVKPYRVHHSCGRVAGIAAGIMAVARAVAGGVCALPRAADEAEASMLATPSLSIAVANDKVISPEPDPGAFVTPTISAAHLSQDGDYLQRLRAANITINDDKGSSTLRKVDASGLASPTDMCRIAMNKLQLNLTGPREPVHGERESFTGGHSWQRSGPGVGSAGLNVDGGGTWHDAG